MKTPYNIPILSAVTPFPTVEKWLEEAAVTEPVYPNAAQLATVDALGAPDVRTVLIKQFGPDGFVFFTNRLSAKGRALALNPNAALLFYWRALSRQLRIRGNTVLVDDTVADRYFAGRPRESQIGAHVSKQSQTLPDRETFERAIDTQRTAFADNAIPRPPHWSGYRLIPTAVEFWQEQPYRLHERVLFEKTEDGWTKRLLYP